jgi:hypothetical protein
MISENTDAVARAGRYRGRQHHARGTSSRTARSAASIALCA